jgi:hypothetical protein
MHAPDLERAIRELEIATEVLLAVENSDLAAICQAIERRADAITALALVSGEHENAHEHEIFIERLAGVMVRGEEATRKLMQARSDVTGEWSRLNRMLNGAGSQARVSTVNIDA